MTEAYDGKELETLEPSGSDDSGQGSCVSSPYWDWHQLVSLAAAVRYPGVG